MPMPVMPTTRMGDTMKVINRDIRTDIMTINTMIKLPRANNPIMVGKDDAAATKWRMTRRPSATLP